MQEPIYVIGYARVSSSKQAQHGDSLELQETKIRNYCESKGWTLFPENKIFREPYTGTSLDRPVYREILEIIKRNYRKYNIKHLVFFDFDRLTRGGGIQYRQIWKDLDQYGVSLRDIRDTIKDEINEFEHFGLKKKYSFAVSRPSEEEEINKTERASVDRARILTKLIGSEIELVQEGYQIGQPDYGFTNERVFINNKKRYIQTRYDPEAIFIEKIFKLRIENNKTDEDICAEINAMGYKSRLKNKWSKNKERIIGHSGGNKMTVKQLQRIISRYSYCGVICESWTNFLPIRAKYKGLVSIDDWNKANRGKVYIDVDESNGYIEIIKDYNLTIKRRKKYNPLFPYKGILLCDICGKTMKASASRGKSGNKFGAYHCERDHKRNAYSQKNVESSIKNLFENIKFSDNFLSIFRDTIYTQFREREGEVAEFVSKANLNISDLEKEKSALVRSFVAATLPEVQEEIERQIVEIKKQIVEAKEKRDTMEIVEADVESFIDWSKKIMEHPSIIFENIGSEQELIATTSLFFDKFPTMTEINNGTPKLSLVFKLSEEYKRNKSQLVTLRGIEPRFDP